MKCERFAELISAFIDNEVTPLEQLALQEHLKSCDKCKSLLASHYLLRDMVSSKKHCDIEARDMTVSIMARVRTHALEEDFAPCIAEPVIELANGANRVNGAKVSLDQKVFTAALAMMLVIIAFASLHLPNTSVSNIAAIDRDYGELIYDHVADISSGEYLFADATASSDFMQLGN